MSVVRRRVFSESYKRAAVERVAASSRSPGAVASELGVHETVLRRWMAQFPATEALPQAADLLAPLPPQPATIIPSPTPGTDLPAENAKLREEVERLRSEREILKKAFAIMFGEMK
jgi:transposase